MGPRDMALRIAGGESDYERSALSLAARNPAVVGILVAATAPEIGDRKTLVFAAGVEHAHDLAAAYDAAGIRAAAVDGSMPPTARATILNAWRAGDIQMVCQDSLLGEGFDFNKISALVLAAPTTSLVRYLQRLGRGTRLAPDKVDCMVLEATPGRPDDRQVSLGQVMPVPEDIQRRKPGPRNPKLVLLDPRASAHWRWLLVTPGIYVAPVDQNRAVWLVRDPDCMGSGLYRAAVLDSDQISPLTGSSVLATRPLRDLQQQAANYLKDHAYLKLAGQDMGWHHTPASEKQLAVLWRWGEDLPPDLTRGEASELITLHIARRKALALSSQLWPEVERQAANG